MGVQIIKLIVVCMIDGGSGFAAIREYDRTIMEGLLIGFLVNEMTMRKDGDRMINDSGVCNVAR